MEWHETEIRVRYSETDKMGFVYYGNYAQYLEVSRVEMLRDHDYTYKALEDSGILMPVVHYEIDYKIPGQYDDLLTIKTRIEGVPTAKVVFVSEIVNQRQETIADAKVILVFIDAEAKRPMKAPEEFLKKIGM